MLQFTDSSGYTWYINNLISFIVIVITVLWVYKQTLTGNKDKVSHCMVSAVLTIIFIWLFPKLNIVWWFSPIVVFLIGVGKEIYDYFHPKKHTCDIKDLMADVIGILFITIFYLFSFIMAK